MSRWGWLIGRRKRMMEDLDQDIRDFIERETQDNIERGLPPEEARYAALRKFGNVTRVKEEAWEVWSFVWLEQLWHDVRFGLRQLRRNPGFTVVTAIVLALGIGANTAVFTVLDAVLLRPLPYKNADRLTVIWQSDSAHRKTGAVFDAYREFQEWHAHSHSFEKLAAATWASPGTTLLWHGERQAVGAMPASVDFFSLLGVPAEQGRTFEPPDLDNRCTVVLSHSFWQNRLGGQSGLVGGTLTLGEQSCRVVGIMPKDFTFYPKQADLWTLITPTSDIARHPWDWSVGAFGLLRPGVSRASAEGELTALQKRIIHESPEWESLNYLPDVLDLQWEFNWLTGRNLETSLILLFVTVVVVLLIACLNVGNSLLGRALDRQKELAIRAALGSGRARLMRQLLTESILLSFCGAALGTLIAYGCIHYLQSASPLDLPPGNPIVVNGHVLAFTAMLAVLTGLLFGILPAWKASRLELNEALKESSRGLSGGIIRQRVARALVIAEVALSLVLLAWAGLLIQSVDRLSSAPLGFRAGHLLTAYLNLPSTTYPQPRQRLHFYEQLVREASVLPGVEGLALSPFFGSGGNSVEVEGNPSPSSADRRDVDEQGVSAGYFHVIGIPVLLGREFDSSDRENSLGVAIVNQALAKEFFPHEDPIGRKVRLGDAEHKNPWLTIVGIVGDVKSMTVFKEMGYVVNPTVYRPLAQDPVSRVSVFVRTAAPPPALAPSLRRVIANLDPLLPSPEVQTMDEWLAQFRSQPRLRATALSIFAGLALLLAAVGIYGVLSQSVARQTHEIGVRMALGAQRADVLRSVVWRGMGPILVGVGLGLVAALALTRFLSNLLYGVRPTDPATLANVSAILAGVAFLASYIPARRATKVDPMVALRYE
jgi:putative ABC transport system permease protein